MCKLSTKNGWIKENFDIKKKSFFIGLLGFLGVPPLSKCKYKYLSLQSIGFRLICKLVSQDFSLKVKNDNSNHSLCTEKINHHIPNVDNNTTFQIIKKFHALFSYLTLPSRYTITVGMEMINPFEIAISSCLHDQMGQNENIGSITYPSFTIT